MKKTEFIKYSIQYKNFNFMKKTELFIISVWYRKFNFMENDIYHLKNDL